MTNHLLTKLTLKTNGIMGRRERAGHWPCGTHQIHQISPNFPFIYLVGDFPGLSGFNRILIMSYPDINMDFNSL